MLLKKAVLEGIKAGEISLQFRRWHKATVKAGGSLKTRIGLLNIHSVETVDPKNITESDARCAGFGDRKALLDQFEPRDGSWFKISLSYGGEDPRIELRNNDEISDEDYAALSKKLFGMDNRSSCGPWTLKVLTAIKEQPQVISTTIAQDLGFERFWMKGNVRKLKALGLTISFKPGKPLEISTVTMNSHDLTHAAMAGYRLSPRGEEVLRRLQHES